MPQARSLAPVRPGWQLAVCNEFVALYKETIGRGPTKVRAHFAGPDVLVVLLEDTLTVAERNLVALGQHQRLRELRLITHCGLETSLRAIVERTLGRSIRSFMSDVDVGEDLAVEVFALEPEAASERRSLASQRV